MNAVDSLRNVAIIPQLFDIPRRNSHSFDDTETQTSVLLILVLKCCQYCLSFHSARIVIFKSSQTASLQPQICSVSANKSVVEIP